MYAIRELDDSLLDPHEEGLIFPLPGQDKDSVVLEARDGESIKRLQCKGIEIRARDEKRPELKIDGIKAGMFLTDSRLAFACSKYDKGGGWIGGVGALALNAGSKALAAHRRKGKMLVGHIRYPWIESVHAQNGSTWRNECLRVVVRIPGLEGMAQFDFNLPRDVDAPAVASEIIRRTARFRLTHEQDLSPEEVARFNEMAVTDDLVWNKADGGMVGRNFGTFWPVGEKSARLGLVAGQPLQAADEDAIVSIRKPDVTEPTVPAPPPNKQRIVIDFGPDDHAG